MLANAATALLAARVVLPPTRPAEVSAPFGCISSTAFSPTIIGSTTAQSSGATCASWCYTNYGTMYAYFQATGTSCVCSNDVPAGQSTYVPSVGTTGGTTYGDCGTGSGNQWQALITDTTFQFSNCIQTSTTLSTSVSVASPEACFKYCVSSPVAYLQPHGTSFACSCVSQNQNQATCDATTGYYYSHPASATVTSQPGAASNWVRRKLKERRALVEAEALAQAYCPASLTPCMVNEDSDAYECINTDEELESCGGCINGQLADVSSVRGVDCNDVPGIESGAVSCVSGLCVAYRCSPGWTLSNTNGTCMAL